MKIAVVHSFYSSTNPSGENLVVDAQVAALRQAGHDVLLIARHTDEEEHRPTYPLRAALSVATGFGASPVRALEQFSPDVVNLHNWFPNFGTRWLKSLKFPSVVTLHNFRTLCPIGTLYR